jgi:hypothetical protein
MSGRTLPLSPPAKTSANTKLNQRRAVSEAPATAAGKSSEPVAALAKTTVKSADLQFSMRVAELVGRVAAALAKSFSGADR